MPRDTPGHGWHCIRATRSEWPGFNLNHKFKSMNRQNIELLKLRLEIAELRENEAVRIATEARAALLLALDGLEQRATPPPSGPDAGTPDWYPTGWRSIDV